jgi:site-specific DNA-methyltransferase (adenine-specific)
VGMINLIHGDCLEEMKKIPDGSIDLVLTDPPYGTTACKWDTVIPFEPMWEQVKRIIKPNGVIVLFGSQPFTSALIMSNPKMFKYEWVWEKNNAGNFQLVNYQPLKIHDTISVFYNETPNMEFANIMIENMKRLNLKQADISKLELSKSGGVTGWVTNKLNGTQLPTEEQWNKICGLFGIKNIYKKILATVKKPTYNLELDETKLILSNKGKSGALGHLSSESKRETYIQDKTGYPKSILKYNREGGFHPTQKPVALMEYLIKTYTNEGETVLDFTMGSGTTGVACKNLNRNFIGIELDKDYYGIAKKRIYAI